MTEDPPPPGLGSAFRAEWVKLRSVRSTTWSLLALAGLTILFTAFVCSALDTEGGSPGNPGDSDVVMLGLTGTYLGQIGAVVLGVLAMTSEYGAQTIRSTFVANPRRMTVLIAKSGIVLGVILSAGLIAVLGSFFLGEGILQGNGFVYANGYPAASLGDGPTLRAVLGSVLYLGALGLMGLGTGAILRSTAAAVTTTLGILYLPMIVQTFLSESARELVQSYAPMPAGLAVQTTVANSGSSLTGDPVPIGPLAGLGIVCAYAVAALILGFWLVKRRDT